MNVKKILWITAATAIAVVAYFAWTLTSRSGYESAAYSVLLTSGPFEVREYPDLLLATTEMRFSPQGDDGGFMRLFRYISGSNEAQQEIAMTTPVFMESEDAATGQMGFVLPESVSSSGAPQPSNDRVKVTVRRGGRFAVIRFNGRLNAETRSSREKQLREWIADQGLSAAGTAEAAGYDPPWTPGPFRRNEVLIRLH